MTMSFSAFAGSGFFQAAGKLFIACTRRIVKLGKADTGCRGNARRYCATFPE